MKFRLLTPGPTPVPEETLLELAKPVFFHRSPEFKAILGEVVSPIEHCLIAREPIDLADIETVVSHPQASAQCARFIRTRLPRAQVLSGSSTAEAVRMVADHYGPWAALVTRTESFLITHAGLTAGFWRALLDAPADARQAALALNALPRGRRDVVFRAWTDPEILKLWWCPEGWIPADIEVDLRVGGSYRIGMRRKSGGSPVYVRGTFLQVNSPEELTYTWKWENAFENMPQTRVTVRFISQGTATVVMLEHGSLPEINICLRHRSGWIAALERVR